MIIAKVIRNIFTLTFIKQLYDCIIEFMIENVSEIRKINIGSKTTISSSVRFMYGENIQIGHNSNINRGCYIWASPNAKIRIGDNCLTGPNVTILCSKYKVQGRDLIRSYPPYEKDIIIENDVWLGANTVILPGVTIGKGSIIGPGVTVSSNIEPYSVIINQKPVLLKER